MGDYGGALNAEILTNDRMNKGASFATLPGKRLIILPELEEGRRLSTSILKQLTSTDDITAEAKFKQPETFTPTHTCVLYTNHLPRVSGTDTGTWRRLAVIPFGAKIPKDSDKKNYGSDLIEKAGGAILSWCIKGAKEYINLDFTLPCCNAVEDATTKYRCDNDWIAKFIDECCEIDSKLSVKSGVLYEKYRDFALKNVNYAMRSNEFKTELEKRGYINRRKNDGVYWCEIGINTDLFDIYQIPPEFS